MVVPYVDEPGGMERQALQLTRHLQDQMNIRVFVLTAVRPIDYLRRHLRGTWPKYGFPVYRLPVPGSFGSFGFFFSCLGTLALIVLREKFDIIHCHQLFSSGLVGGLCAKFLHKPVVAKAACGGEDGDIWFLARMSFPEIVKALLSRIHLFVCVSPQIRLEIQDWLGQTDAQFVDLFNFVDTERYKPVTEDQKNSLRRQLRLSDGLQVVFVGRLDPVKGIDTLLGAWKEIVSHCPGTHLTILGTGELREELEDICIKGGLKDLVSFRGRVENVTAHLQAADMLVLPSLAEGMPNAVLEAMACGLPVAATDIPGTNQACRNGLTGLLVEVGNRKALVSATVRLLRDTEMRQTMGRNGRMRAEKHFSLAEAANQYSKLYVSLLASVPRGQRSQ
jgi:glycosyltransferase involved in cell wall biosynthesis